MILAVKRAVWFSPNSVDKDEAIIESVSDKLRIKGFDVETVSETQLDGTGDYDVIISMGRGTDALDVLREKEAKGTPVINSTASVVLCGNRRRLTTVLREGGVRVPDDIGGKGLWLKRAVGTSQTPLDVQYAANERERADIERRMHDAGITDIMTCAHIEGDLVKFYGVCGSDFFSIHYPGDDGEWKYDDERRNGTPHHYPFDEATFRAIANKAAQIAGLTVYGGDAIVEHDGRITIIDLNDWPSFSRCRERATAAIAEVIADRCSAAARKKEHLL